jgi:alkaline phosphatase
MKHLLSIFLFLFTVNLLFAQPHIHAHNDYQQPQPLVHAVHNKVFSLEADVFLVKDKLLVAHDTKELFTVPKLKSLYLKPVIKLFKKHQGRISADTDYSPVLMLNINKMEQPPWRPS